VCSIGHLTLLLDCVSRRFNVDYFDDDDNNNSAQLINTLIHSFVHSASPFHPFLPSSVFPLYLLSFLIFSISSIISFLLFPSFLSVCLCVYLSFFRLVALRPSFSEDNRFGETNDDKETAIRGRVQV
jgi:hypothetical protein